MSKTAIDCLNAWVLHKKWHGDSGFIVTFFTKEKGLVRGLCRGSKYIKNQSLIQQFNPLWITYEEKGSWTYINKIESTSVSLYLKNINLLSGLYLNELLFYTLHPFDEQVELFDAYVTTIYQLQEVDNRKSVEVLLRTFEKNMLSLLGYGLNLSHDATSNQRIELNSSYNYIAGLGLVKADNGIPGHHIDDMNKNDFSKDCVLRSAKKIFRIAIDNVLNGKELNVRGYVR